jgi:integrase/recombinase XerD
MQPLNQTRFNNLYQAYLNELILQGKSPKIIDCYSRCLGQITEYFNLCPDHFTTEGLRTYFLYLVF